MKKITKKVHGASANDKIITACSDLLKNACNSAFEVSYLDKNNNKVVEKITALEIATKGLDNNPSFTILKADFKNIPQLNYLRLGDGRYLNAPVNYETKRPYTGLNAMILPIGQYLGYQAITKLGGQCKGAKGYPITIYQEIKLAKITYFDEEKGEQIKDKIIYANKKHEYEDKPNYELIDEFSKSSTKTSYVFNIQDCQNLPDIPFPANHPNVKSEPLALKDVNDPNNASCYLANYYLKNYDYNQNITVYDSNEGSYYVPKDDEIHCIPKENFDCKTKYYEQLIHEHMHSTGHQSRLNRDSLIGVKETTRFGDAVYNTEEVTAEFATLKALVAFSMITNAQFFNVIKYCACYLNSPATLQAIKDDPSLPRKILINAENAFNFFLEQGAQKFEKKQKFAFKVSSLSSSHSKGDVYIPTSPLEAMEKLENGEIEESENGQLVYTGIKSSDEQKEQSKNEQKEQSKQRKNKQNNEEGYIKPENYDAIKYCVEKNYNVLLSGPAGTGKTSIAFAIAKDLGLDFYTDSAVSDGFSFTGYYNAQGGFNESNFYKAFKNGGVYLLDEMDGCDPNALLQLNQATANGFMNFPNGERIQAHPNFRYIAATNTLCNGASQQYNGRYKQDAACLDRFGAKFIIDFDKRIEKVCCDIDDLRKFIQAFRNAAFKLHKDNVCISYRGMSNCCKMIKDGVLSKDKVLDVGILYGLSSQELSQIKQEMTVLQDNEYVNILDLLIKNRK